MSVRNRKDTRNFFLFSGISIFGFLVFYVYPIFRTIFLSFTNTSIMDPLHDFVGWKNFKRAILYDDVFHLALKNTFKYAIFVAALKLALALLAAMLLNNKIRGIGIFRAIFFLPFIIPTFAVSYVFRFFFHPANGLVNQMLKKVGVEGIGWYADSKTAMITLVISSLWGFGVPMLIFLAALQQVPKELYEVANLDGATRWQQFRVITFPAISAVFLFNVILSTVDSLKSFDLAFLMGHGEGYPANSTLLYSVYLFNQAFRNPWSLGYASALALIFFVVLLVLTAINFGLGRLYVKNEN
ncbi:MAG: sugar ABC transporter permease [Actinobacteria bacterium]|nr:sugar ABC transporter permease [Actinomycetota bacterium]